MRAVVQRVTEARVKVDNETVGEIGTGLLVLLGVKKGDSEEDLDYLADKIANLRIFPDNQGRMNLSALDLGYEALVVSQFTLLGDCRKGRRPSYFEAEEPERAEGLYLKFIDALKERGIRTACGQFQAMMDVELINHGPVTLLIDSEKTF